MSSCTFRYWPNFRLRAFFRSGKGPFFHHIAIWQKFESKKRVRCIINLVKSHNNEQITKQLRQTITLLGLVLCLYTGSQDTLVNTRLGLMWFAQQQTVSFPYVKYTSSTVIWSRATNEDASFHQIAILDKVDLKNVDFLNKHEVSEVVCMNTNWWFLQLNATLVFTLYKILSPFCRVQVNI